MPFLFYSIMLALDPKDMKIITCIADEGDLPYSAVGERTHISKDSVKARITRLMDARVIISFIPQVEYSRIHYSLFHVFLKFGSLLQQRDDFVQRTKDHGSVVKLTRVIGEYDYEVELLAKDDQHLYSILNEVLSQVKKSVSRIHPMRETIVHLYSMQIGKFKKEFPQSSAPSTKKKGKCKIDQLDLDILKKLSLNARALYVEMAKEMKTTPENIRYRIKRMVENGTILRFHARVNKNALGLNTYILLLDLLGNLELGDIAFLENIENVYSIKSGIGQWNVMVSFYAQDNNELVKTLEQIRDHLKQKLSNFELLILLDRFKLVPVPQGITL